MIRQRRLSKLSFVLTAALLLPQGASPQTQVSKRAAQRPVVQRESSTEPSEVSLQEKVERADRAQRREREEQEREAGERAERAEREEQEKEARERGQVLTDDPNGREGFRRSTDAGRER